VGIGGPSLSAKNARFLRAGPVDGHQAGRQGVVSGKPRFQEHDELELPPTVCLVESSQVELADLRSSLDWRARLSCHESQGF